MKSDLRFAARTLLRSPGYTLAALLTLVLGIGANTAVFSVVNGILLSPLPFADPDRLVVVWEENGRGGRMQGAWRNFLDWRERNRSFASLAAHANGGETTVLGLREPLRVHVTPVSDGFFSTLGVQPVLGRGFLPAEHVLGGDPVVVVSDGLWRTHFGAEADPSARRLTVGAHAARVVGVMPRGFDYPNGSDIWYPLELNQQSDHRTAHNYVVLARLARGVDGARAEADLDAITARFLDEDPAAAAEDWFEDFYPRGAGVQPLREALVGSTRRPLVILLGASVLVLLVACTNLASATLARGAGREREYAVRRSLGASRGRLVTQLFTESLVLALAGGALGVLLAAICIRLLPVLAPAGIPRIDEVGVNLPVLAAALVVSAATAVLFGLLPALRVSGESFGGPLRGGARGGFGRARQRVWRVLVGIEVALALMLLVGAGLLIRSFRTVLAVEPGFRTEGVLTATVSPPSARYGDNEPRRGFYDALLRELEAIPGVADVGLIAAAPMSGISNGRVDVRGGPSRGATGDYQLASGGYFRAMGIPALRGRLFDERDGPDARHVVVVNRAFAEAAWPGQDPIGKQMTGGGMDDYWDQEVYATVIGVVADVRQRDLTLPPRPTYYFPYRQRPFRAWSMTALVRPASGRAADLGPVIRETIRRIDTDVPVTLGTIEARLADSLTPRRFTMTVLGVFAGVALLLACIGIWGVVSYAVARRTREIGIRMALGADAGSVRRLVQRDFLRAAAAGGLAGLALALALTRVLEGLLYEVEPTDPVTIALVAALLGAAAWLASFVPSLRSTRVNPIDTMRVE